jgi:hypothetical protein
MKIALTLMFSAIFAYGIASMLSGRVYCKGCWYERCSNPLGFWFTIALYVIGPPIILAIAWKAG